MAEPLAGSLLFDHAREPANFVVSLGKTTGRSEPGEISSVTPRSQRKAARVSPRGFYEG